MSQGECFILLGREFATECVGGFKMGHYFLRIGRAPLTGGGLLPSDQFRCQKVISSLVRFTWSAIQIESDGSKLFSRQLEFTCFNGS